PYRRALQCALPRHNPYALAGGTDPVERKSRRYAATLHGASADGPAWQGGGDGRRCRLSRQRRVGFHHRYRHSGRWGTDPVTDAAEKLVEAPVQAPIPKLESFCRAALLAVGADNATSDAATRAMMHGSRLGIDSHGVRLLDHYCRVLAGGRVNGKPQMRVLREFGAVATL